MADKPFTDFYEALEVSSNASAAVIEAAFRVLSQRYHPSQPDGDSDRHALITAAYTTFTTPDHKLKYDSYYTDSKPWAPGRSEEEDEPLSSSPPGTDVLESDREIRTRIMTLLYESRRNQGPLGVGDYALEQSIGIPVDQLQFHLWYIISKEWIFRNEEGRLAITVQGIDELNSLL